LYLSNVDKIFVLKNGSVVAGGSYAELKSSGEDFVKLLNTVENDEEVSVDTDQASANGNRRSTGILKESDLPVPVKEQRSVGTVSKKIYLEYFRFGGSYVSASLMLLAFILTQVGASGVDYFLTVWVNLEQEALEKSDNSSTTVELQTSFETNTDNLLSAYSLIIIFLIVVASVRSVSFVRFCMKASKYLHNSMFAEIVRAPMRFFNTNPSGRILNRFSRDVGIVDETLPTSLMDTIQVALNVIAITILLSLVNPWIIIPTIVIFGIFYGYKTVFLSTSRNLKRIEGTGKLSVNNLLSLLYKRLARSPIFSHLAASLQGLSTIRAFDAQEVLQMEFDNIQDCHSSAFYMFMACSRTFAFWLDINCIIYIGLVIFSLLFMETETYGGNAGLAITQSISLTGMLQRGIRQWSELENQMTSVERIVE
jgi:ATP-binding cassette subfamily C (CFTR/MRP) protein 4